MCRMLGGGKEVGHAVYTAPATATATATCLFALEEVFVGRAGVS